MEIKLYSKVNKKKNMKVSKTLWNKQPFGQKTDSEIARNLGVSRERVRQVRNKKQIKKITSKKDLIIQNGVLGVWTDWEIADHYGISEGYVWTVRMGQGIEAPEREPTRVTKILKILKEHPGLNVNEISQFLFGDTSAKFYKKCRGTVLYLFYVTEQIERVSRGRFKVKGV